MKNWMMTLLFVAQREEPEPVPEPVPEPEPEPERWEPLCLPPAPLSVGVSFGSLAVPV